MADKLSPLVLVEDEPVPGHLVDQLGIVQFSRVVAGAALGTRGPFTIGIFGDWGRGKTSVLKQAKSLLEHEKNPGLVTVMFNAWQYEHEEHPIVPLVATIVRAVEEKIIADNDGRLAGNASKAAVGTLAKIARALRAIAYGFSAKTKVGVPGIVEVEAGFMAKEMIERYEKLSLPSDPLLDRTLYYNAFEALDNAAGTDKKDQSPPHKIVVFIDDLDRCLPPQALKLLEGIKIVLAQRGLAIRVTDLMVDSTNITGRALSLINRLENLRGLSLSATDVDDDNLFELTMLKKLRVLRLDRTSITDAGLKALGRLRSLEKLSLGETPITNDGLAALEKLHKLLWLDVSGTAVTAQGVTAFRRKRPLCDVRWSGERAR